MTIVLFCEMWLVILVAEFFRNAHINPAIIVIPTSVERATFPLLVTNLLPVALLQPGLPGLVPR